MIEYLNDIFSEFKNRCSNPRVLVLGDIMLDNYLYGDASRLSPEAPVPVVNYTRQELMLGGCGNVIKNLVEFGINTGIISVVGRDSIGAIIEKQLISLSVDIQGLIKSENRPSTEKMRVIAQNQQIVRFDREATFDIDEMEVSQLKKEFDLMILDYDLVLISDYSKGVLTDAFCRYVISRCNDLKKLVMVDPKISNFNKYSGAFLVKPNLAEAKLISGSRLDSVDELISATNFIRAEHNINSVVITMGSKGVFYNFGPHGKVDAHRVGVYDVSGAGDTFFAALTLCIILGVRLSDAVIFSNAAASIVIQKFGSQVTSIDQVLKFLNDEKNI